MDGKQLQRKLMESKLFSGEEMVTIYACVMEGIRSVGAGTFDPENCYGERTKEHLREWAGE